MQLASLAMLNATFWKIFKHCGLFGFFLRQIISLERYGISQKLIIVNHAWLCSRFSQCNLLCREQLYYSTSREAAQELHQSNFHQKINAPLLDHLGSATDIWYIQLQNTTIIKIDCRKKRKFEFHYYTPIFSITLKRFLLDQK